MPSQHNFILFIDLRTNKKKINFSDFIAKEDFAFSKTEISNQNS